MDVQTLEKVKQQWQAAADMMPQLLCLLNAKGELIHTNRTVERWGLGNVASVKGLNLHDILHQNCSDPACYFKPFWQHAVSQLACGARTESEIFDPVLKRHVSLLVQPLIRPHHSSKETEDLHAIIVMDDISEFKQAEAGYQRIFEELECLACKEQEQRLRSEGIQAHLLAILEKTTDYIAMSDANGKMLYMNPAGRRLLGLAPEDDISGLKLCEYSDESVKERIWGQAIPEAIRSGHWKGEARLRDSEGREIDTSQVIIAHRGLDGQLEKLSTVLRDTTEQVRTAQALRESRDELRRLSAMLVTIQEDERRRIALDLHDGLGQSLSLIKLAVENSARLMADFQYDAALDTLQKLIPRLKDALADVRRVSTELRPSILDDLGILPTLSWFFREFEAVCGSMVIEKDLTVSEQDVPPSLRITLYRLLQEATSNILKHSAADRIRVGLHRDGDTLHFSIEDNGCGFEPALMCAQCEECDISVCRGIGLVSMKERVTLSGGNYLLESSPGFGTRIQASWPVG